MRYWMQRSAAIAILLVVLGIRAACAGDMYLQLGPIKGECRVPGHEEAIVIDSFSYTTSQPPAPGGRGERNAARQSQELQFSKAFDSASPLILEFLWSGKTLADEVIITVGSGTGDAAKVLKFILSGVVISNYTIAGDKGDPRESIVLSFSKIRVECQQIGKTIDATLDLQKGK